MKINHSHDEVLLARKEILTAIELLIARMDAIEAQCGDNFPLYSCGTEDRWTVSQGGSWVGGFWSGWWWLRARFTGSMSDQRKASQICQRLYQKINAASINRSMIFWYGAALGDIWFGDENARRLTCESAAALAASIVPEMQCIPLGTDMGGGAEGDRRVAIDTLAPTIQLLTYGEHGRFQNIAQQHMETVLAACRTQKGAYHCKARYEQGVLRPTDQAGVWSRGQAWAILGLSRAAARWGEPYLGYAQSACEYWLSSRTQPLPPHRLDQPSGHYDPSAALIASLSMLALAALVPDGERWVTCAHRQITALVRSRYFTGLREEGDGVAAGIFWGACYEIRQGKDELVESAWGSFFLMEALCILLMLSSHAIRLQTDCRGLCAENDGHNFLKPGRTLHEKNPYLGRRFFGSYDSFQGWHEGKGAHWIKGKGGAEGIIKKDANDGRTIQVYWI